MKRIGLIVLLLAVADVSFGAGRARWKYPWIHPARLRLTHRVQPMLWIEVQCLRNSFKYQPIDINGVQVQEMVATPSSKHLSVTVKLRSGDGKTFGAEHKDNREKAEAFVKALVPEIEKRFTPVGPKQEHLRLWVYDDKAYCLSVINGGLRTIPTAAK